MSPGTLERVNHLVEVCFNAVVPPSGEGSSAGGAAVDPLALLNTLIKGYSQHAVFRWPAPSNLELQATLLQEVDVTGAAKQDVISLWTTNDGPRVELEALLQGDDDLLSRW